MDLRMTLVETLLMAKREKPLPAPERPQWNRLYIKERLDRKAGRTQEWLASQTGFSTPYISLILNGKRPYNQRFEEACEAALGVEKGALRHPPNQSEMRRLLQNLDDDERKNLAQALIDALKGN